jgi:phosphoribosylaminoimidazolecarboxamide formyltransferase/IMP cyclohydrolase
MNHEAGIALLSVYDKTGITDFALGLSQLGWTIYASGGTAKALQEAGIEVIDVAEMVGGKAILGHRVVTLSREISAGLLADKKDSDDMAEMQKLGLPIIDLVCVDMYPLEEAINGASATKDEVILKTDIGGPTMLRSAAKGKRIVVPHAELRQPVLDWLKNGRPDEGLFLDKLAARAEYEVARYVSISADYLNQTDIGGLLAKKMYGTKYGENPQQASAAFYADNRLDIDPLGLDKFEHIQGMEKSFINMTDMDRLLQTLTHIAAGYERNFKSVPFMAVGVKHGNACGAAVSDNLVDATQKMLLGDTRAIFGGVVMLNSDIDESVAETLMHYAVEGDKPRLLDGVVGSSVTPEALELLSRNKLRVVVNPALKNLTEISLDNTSRLRPVRGGFLMQPNYNFVLDFKDPSMQIHGEINDQQKRDLVLAWAIGCTSNSNTISIAVNGQLIGNGVGQQDRVGAAQLAITRTSNVFPEFNQEDDKYILKVEIDKNKLTGAVAYSDSFFPFSDGPELLAKVGIKCILSSSGSIGDKSVISTLEANKVTVALIPDRQARGFYMH